MHRERSGRGELQEEVSVKTGLRFSNWKENALAF